MEAEVFVYGTPYGEDFCGKEEDKKYFGNLYDGSSDELKFLIQTRLLNGKPYCYYNYIVYKNIVDNDGRDGGFFGISLRFDVYCKDIMNLYRILDTIYNVYVLGHLLKADRAKFKYTISSFASISGTLKNIEDVTLQLVQDALSNDSFLSLNAFFTGTSNGAVCNLYDCTTDNILKIVRQYGKVAISPYYPSGKEKEQQKQYEELIQATQKQYETRLQTDANMRANEKKDMDKKLSFAKTQIRQLQEEVSRKDDDIRQLGNEVSQLKSQINNIGKTRKIASIIAPIQNSIIDLAEEFRSIVPETDKPRHNVIGNKMEGQMSIIKIIRALVPFVNLVLIIFIACYLCLFPNERESRIYYDRNNEEKAISGYNEQETDSTSEETFNIDNVKIDVINYNGGELSKDSIYEVRADGGIDIGFWNVKGCLSSNFKDSILTIWPREDIVTITYCIGEKKKSCTFKAK